MILNTAPKIWLLLLLIINCLDSRSQITPQTRFIQNGVGPRSFLDVITPPPPGLEGSYYFDDDWHVGSLQLTDGETIHNIPLRYDIFNSCTEVQTQETMKVCPTKYLKSFGWYNFTTADSVKFIMTSQYAHDNDPFMSAFELLVDGDIALYAKVELEIHQSNYLPALDLGEPEKKVIRKEKFFLATENKILPINPKLSDNLMYFEPYMNELAAYAKKEGLKCRKRNDLILLVTHYNALKTLGIKLTLSADQGERGVER